MKKPPEGMRLIDTIHGVHVYEGMLSWTRRDEDTIWVQCEASGQDYGMVRKFAERAAREGLDERETEIYTIRTEPRVTWVDVGRLVVASGHPSAP